MLFFPIGRLFWDSGRDGSSFVPRWLGRTMPLVSIARVPLSNSPFFGFAPPTLLEFRVWSPRYLKLWGIPTRIFAFPPLKAFFSVSLLFALVPRQRNLNPQLVPLFFHLLCPSCFLSPALAPSPELFTNRFPLHLPRVLRAVFRRPIRCCGRSKRVLLSFDPRLVHFFVPEAARFPKAPLAVS